MDGSATILAVDDNPLTRGVIRAALENHGYAVVEAVDGTSALARATEHIPDLVVQDLTLPDCGSGEFLRRLRALPGGANLPVVALSGAHERGDADAPFSGFLCKPIEPSRLVETVQQHLWSVRGQADADGRGRRVLVVDDDADQRNLLQIHLRLRGFEVTEAGDAEQALQLMRHDPPDAVVSDVMMPRLDGFELCLEMRRDEVLVRIPVVLTSTAYCDAADHALGNRVGASAYVPRTPALEGVMEALSPALAITAPPVSGGSDASLREAHARRVAQQLDRVAVHRAHLTQACTVQQSVLTMLGTLTSGAGDDLGRTLGEMLESCVDFLGARAGALYRCEEGTHVLQVGAPVGSTAALADLGGQKEVLCGILRSSSTPVVLPSLAVPTHVSQGLLEALGLEAAILAPFSTEGVAGAVLLDASWERDLTNPTLPATSAVALQLGQTAALAHAISRCKQAERASLERARLAEASETMLRSVLESATDAIVTFDQHGLVMSWNGGAQLMTGYVVEEVVGRPVLDLLTVESREAWRRALEEGDPMATRDLAARHELQGLRKDGSDFPLELSIGSYQTAQGRFYTAIARDITARKDLERQLLHAQKMEALGQLCGGVAHDFNNLLTAIGGYAELLLQDVHKDVPECLREILGASRCAADLTRQLLTFSRRQVVAARVLDFNAVVAKVERLLHRVIGEDVELRVEQLSEAAHVKADPAQLEQVIMNLAVNARDAMPQGGRLRIRSVAVDLPLPLRRGTAVVPAGKWVQLHVSDTGSGMDAAVLPHIFEPFFTTKEPGKGTGLGLSTVYGIVKQAGGEIVVWSVAGQGTTFEVYLPRVAEAVGAPEAPPSLVAQGGTETILVAEDEEHARNFVGTLLKRAGYRVLLASNGSEALRICLTEAGPIHMLLTDTVMPVMGGRQLAERVVAQRPETPVLYMSGYTTDAMLRHGVLSDQVSLVQKPFRSQELLLRVRAILDGGKSG